MTTTPIRPPLDAESEAALAAMAAELPEITLEDLPRTRRTLSTLLELTQDELDAFGVSRREITIPGHDGTTLEATVYARADHVGQGPGIYHVHGGGMMLGTRHTGIQQLLPWLRDHDAVAVTLEYRLAPEHPDPTPVEDCYAGLVWTARHAEELGIDPDRLLIAGASAGGGLAAGTALLARDRGGPALIGQLLDCPMIDDRDATVSTHQYPDLGTWVRASNVTGWSALLGERRGGEDVSPYAAPARARDLSGLPPAFIACGSAEVFRDEDVAYAAGLWRDGGQAELHVWPGGFHGFDMIAPHTALAQAAIAARDAWLARLLAD